MEFNHYQQRAIKFDTANQAKDKDTIWQGFIEKVLGLAGETGEVIEKIKKIVRDKDFTVSTEDKIEISKELGDVLWYLSALSFYLDIPLDDLAKNNLAKLEDRHSRNMIKGSGDNR